MWTLRPQRGKEGRSNFVVDGEPSAPSNTNPCVAPDETRWVWAENPVQPDDLDLRLVGKWLIYVSCLQVGYCWSRVREATEDGSLGISAKVSTDWGKAHDLAGMVAEGIGGWRDHVVCISRLAEVDAVRQQVLNYKPDAFTYGGTWAGNSPGEVAIYSMKKPYQELLEHPENLKTLVRAQVGVLESQEPL